MARSAAEKPKKTRKKRVALAIAAASFAVLSLAAYGLAQTDAARAWARAEILRVAREELGLEARLGGIDIRVFPPSVAVLDVALRHPAHGPLVSARSVRVTPSLSALLSGQLDLEGIEIEAPVATLVIRDGEIKNFPTPKAAGDDGPSRLPFRDLAISDATVSVDAVPYARGVLRDVDIDVAVEDGVLIEARVRAARGMIAHTKGRDPITHLDARVRVTPAFVQIHTARLDTPHVRVRARALRIALPIGSDIAGHVEADVDLGYLGQLPLPFAPPDVEGWVMAKVDGRFDQVHGPSGRGSIETRRVRVKQFIVGEASLRVAGDRTQITIEEGSEANIMRGGGTVGIAAELKFAPGLPLDAKIDIRGLEFEKLMEQLGVSKFAIVEWLLDGQIRLRGKLDPLLLEGPIRTQTRDFMVSQGAWWKTPRRRVIGVSHANIHGGVRVDLSGLRFVNLLAELPRSRIEADVLLGFDSKRLSVDARSRSLDLADCTPLLAFDLEGTGGVHVVVDGTYDEQQVYGHVDMSDFRFDSHGFGDIATDFRLEKNAMAVRMPSVEARLATSRYRLDDFVLDFSDDRFLLTSRLHADRFVLRDFFGIVHYEDDERFTGYQGVFQGDAAVRFTMGFPGDRASGTLITDVDFALPEVAIEGLGFRDGQVQGRWRWFDWPRGYEGGELTIDRAVLHKGRGALAVDGRMREGGKLAFTAVLDQLALREIEGIGERYPSLGGSADLVARIEGTPAVPRVHIDAALTALSWKGRALGDARMYVRLTDVDDPWVQAARGWDTEGPPADAVCPQSRIGLARGRWAPDPPLRTRDGLQTSLSRPMAFLVCGEALDGKVALDMALGRTRVYPLRGLVKVRDLDLAPFLPSSGGEGGTTGRITASALLTGGSLREDDSLSGRVVIDEMRASREGVEVRNDGPVDVRLRDGSFEFVRARLTGPSSRVALSGGGSLTRGLDTGIEGELDMRLLASLSPWVTEAAGRIGVQVRVLGPFQNPEVFGSADITAGPIRIAGFEEAIDGIEGHVSLSERSVRVERFEARVAGGTVDVSGEASLRGRGLGDVDLRVRARNLALRPSAGIDVILGADARVLWQGDEPLPRLRGDVRVMRLHYTRPVALGATLGELARQSRQEVDEYDPAADHIALDLRVLEEGPLEVQNNLVDATLHIEDAERPFRIVGTDQRYGVLGSISVDQGKVRFRNTEFEIRRGVLDFEDETKVDPRFDVRAVTAVRRGGGVTAPSWRVNLHAYGTREEFRLDTSSEPELPQEDIVLLLTIGMTRAEVEQLRNSSLGTSAALEALATVTGFDRTVREAVPLIDDFRISSAYSMRTNRTEPTVSIGKRLTDRIRLSATTGLGEAREIRTSLEWGLDDQTSVQAGYDNLDNTGGGSAFGNAGADVRWRLEFE